MASSPRWVDAIHAALKVPENKGQVVYQLATVDADGKPHVRTMGFREIFVPASAPNLPLVVSMTDIRTPKVSQLGANPHVEISWWLSGSREQFRIAGTVRLIPAPGSSIKVSGPSMIGADKTLEEGVDWEKKRLEVFDSLPGFLKAGYSRPSAPGTIIPSHDEAKKWPAILPKLGDVTEADKPNVNFALNNYALVLIEPMEVDWVQLAVAPNQRTRFVRKGDQWTEEITIP